MNNTSDLKFTCPICSNKYKSYVGVSSHLSREHHIGTPAARYMAFHNITEIPKCKCGCGNDVKFFPGKGGWFGEYLVGHVSRTNGGFQTKEGLEKSANTRRERFASGEIVQWNKGTHYTAAQMVLINERAKRPDRRAKISKALKGRPKTEEHKKIMLVQLAKNRKELLKGNPSKLEYTFAEILTGLGIEHIHQYNVDGFEYDFYIPEKNLLLEVDGDYWHGNPNVYDELQLNGMQRKNRGLDTLKDIHAKKHGYNLVRIWEKDIRSNRLTVVQKLIDIIRA